MDMGPNLCAGRGRANVPKSPQIAFGGGPAARLVAVVRVRWRTIAVFTYVNTRERGTAQMNIAVIGAGIVGLSTARALAWDGHSVTLYEARRAVAEEASFACAGWITPAALLPLSVPGLSMALDDLRRTPHTLAAQALPGTALWRWMRRWKKLEALPPSGAYAELAQHPLGVAQALATFGQKTRSSVQLQDAECRREGALVLLSNERERQHWLQHQLPLLAALGVSAQPVSADEARAMEPALSENLALHSAIHIAQAENFNPRMWAQLLRQELVALGARVWTVAEVERVHPSPLAVQVAGQSVPYDAVVLCTGAHVSLLQSLGLRLPLVAARGYTVTAPLRQGHVLPQTALLHWGAQMPITRMGQRVRISAGAELVPIDRAAALAAAADDHATLAAMYERLGECLGAAVQITGEGVHIWRGVQALLPDGLPAVGASGLPGIWLNVAHGTAGVGQAAGCAQALSDQITHGGATPDGFDLAPLAPQRFD